MENAIIEEFSKMINQCKGQVFFITTEGERILADSMLSALVGFSSLLSFADISPVHFECEQIEDCERIMEFVKKHQLGTYRKK